MKKKKYTIVRSSKSVTHKHDKGYKRIFAKNRNFLHFLKKYIQAEWGDSFDETDLVPINTTLINKEFRNRESDVIYRLKLKDKEIIFYTLCELQSSVDKTMPFRLLRYMTLLLEYIFENTPENLRESTDFKLPAVVPIILYNGSDNWTVARSFKEYLQGYEQFGEYVIDFQYFLFDLKRTTNEEIQNSNQPLDVVFLLDKIRNDTEFMEEILRAASEMTGKLDNDSKDDVLSWIEHIYLEGIEEAEKSKILSNFERGDVSDMMYGIDYIKQEAEKIGEEKANKKARKENLEIAKSLLEVIDFDILVEKFKLTNEEIKILKGNN